MNSAKPWLKVSILWLMILNRWCMCSLFVTVSILFSFGMQWVRSNALAIVEALRNQARSPIKIIPRRLFRHRNFAKFMPSRSAYRLIKLSLSAFRELICSLMKNMLLRQKNGFITVHRASSAKKFAFLLRPLEVKM